MMPLYDYRCQECGHLFEQRHGWDEHAAACPACASASVQRQLPTFAVIGRAGSSQAAVAEADPIRVYAGRDVKRPGCASRLN